jgi:hypothetical protein
MLTGVSPHCYELVALQASKIIELLADLDLNHFLLPDSRYVDTKYVSVLSNFEIKYVEIV